MADPSVEEWLATLPASTVKLVREFSPGTEVMVNGQVMYVVSYGEDDDMIRISPINPCDDYDASMAARVPICAAHLRE